MALFENGFPPKSTHFHMIPTEPYLEQIQRWPASGRHILASFDEETILVYQAYAPAIGHFALRQGYFGGDFSYRRMSWIKPNFLWMMYRSDWGQSLGQEIVLGIRLRRTFFDTLLEQAIPSSFSPELFTTDEAWKVAVAQSEVRLQWDPDHEPSGGKVERKAIQLGLRGAALEAYGQREIVEIIDMSAFVAEQRANAPETNRQKLVLPAEHRYDPSPAGSQRIGLNAQ